MEQSAIATNFKQNINNSIVKDLIEEEEEEKQQEVIFKSVCNPPTPLIKQHSDILYNSANHPIGYSLFNTKTTDWTTVGYILPVQVFINVATALLILQFHMSNQQRTISKKYVKKYAEAIIKGQWDPTGQPITFDKYGKLINGQHRIKAIIEASKMLKLKKIKNINLIVPFEIRLGAEPDVFSKIDCGSSRSPKDMITITNAISSHTNHINANDRYYAQVAKNVKFYKANNKISDGDSISNDDILDVINNNPNIYQSVNECTKYHFIKSIGKCIPAAALIHFTAWEQTGCRKQADDFIQKFGSGSNLTIDSPILAYRNQIMNSGGGKVRPYQLVSYLIDTWNDFIIGTKVYPTHIYSWNKTTGFPIIK